MPLNPVDTDALQHAIETELREQHAIRRRVWFRLHTIVFVTTTLLAWATARYVYQPVGRDLDGMLVVLGLLTGSGLVTLLLHYAAVRLDSDREQDALRERAMGRVLQQMLEANAKPKSIPRRETDEEFDDLHEFDTEPTAEHR